MNNSTNIFYTSTPSEHELSSIWTSRVFSRPSEIEKDKQTGLQVYLHHVSQNSISLYQNAHANNLWMHVSIKLVGKL